jgi:hypothetical protein
MLISQVCVLERGGGGGDGGALICINRGVCTHTMSMCVCIRYCDTS